MQPYPRSIASTATIERPRPTKAVRTPLHLVIDQTQGSFHHNVEGRTNLDHVYPVLASCHLEMVYQPALRLNEHRVEFIEALARFRSKPYMAPDKWFTAAAKAGVGMELEILALKSAIEGMHKLPSGSTISINVSPGTILTQNLASQLASVPPHRVILEITEHDAVECYATLVEALRPLRQSGVRVAVDDVGAGYSSFAHILQLRPDFIKLDISLSSGIDKDPVRRALASALVTFAHQTGIEMVAEGVETACELRSLRDLGVNIVQGHIIARPTRTGKVAAMKMGSRFA